MFYLDWLAQSALSSVVISLPGALELLLVLLGLLMIFAPRGLGLRILALPLFLPALLFNIHIPETEGFEVHILDVGQGMAVLVYAEQETLLFDTGGRVSSELSMIDAVVLPFLRATGRRKIDTLIVSHADDDHAFGVKDVVRHFPDVQVYASQPSDLQIQHTMRPCIAGEQWAIGNVQFGFLHPARSDRGSDNNLSCVLLIYMGNSRVLLTGDIEASAERKLVSRLAKLDEFPITMMSAPHHGSSTSSSQALLDMLAPQYVVFPAGLANRYGFPHRDVQLRYKLVGSESLVTGHDGALSFLFSHKGLTRTPGSWWNSHRRFWHGIVNADCLQHFAVQSPVVRLLRLAQKGKKLCGK